MKLDRAALLGKIRMVMPAVASKSPIEGLTHLWMNGSVMFGFNDVVAIECPCTVPATGGVYGGTFLGMLEKSAATDVDVEATESEVVLKQGSSRSKLPILPYDRAIYPFPDDLGNPACIIDAAFRNALDHVSLSIPSAGHYIGTGVTLLVEDELLSFYTTDAATLSWASVPRPEGYDKPRLNLSPVFCAQLLAVCGKDDGVLYVFEESAVAVAKSGARVYGRLMEAPKELDFAGVIAGTLPEHDFMPLPETLQLVLERTQVLVVSGQVARVHATVDQGVLRMHLRTDRGELHEALRLKGKQPSAKLEGVFDSALVLRALSRASEFILTDRAFIMLGPVGGYMASAPSQ